MFFVFFFGLDLKFVKERGSENIGLYRLPEK